MNRRQLSWGWRGGRHIPLGFTLVELLMVIAVISLLVGVLVPSLMQARLLAKRVACGANFRSLGAAAGLYQSDFGEYVPIAWQNLGSEYLNPWKSWRASLLGYTAGFGTFNCPSAQDNGGMGELFHSDSEVTTLDREGTANAGSYGVLYQYSRPSYNTVNYSGIITQGHPIWSFAFSTVPGAAWTDPANSVYAADAYIAKGPVSYPSRTYKAYGTSAIMRPSDPGYFAELAVSRRFADRHLGTCCLLVDQHVEMVDTEKLDHMAPGAADCIWDVD
ncbi:MAG TPA: hypothetical protein DCX07_01675 [Phycisphaerales bacterium]|nr:hypothetical protein [Phycisphaerales bacterium]